MHIQQSATHRALRPAALALCAAITAILSQTQNAALAQETLNANVTLDEIVVNARRREENIQNVPVAVTALSAETLRDLSVSQTDDLRFAVAGFTIAAQVSKDSPTLVIRGQRRSLGGDAAPSVITYLADIPLPNDGSIVPTYDIQSIQVLKGPQGTLFGRNTTGGALLIYPTAPSYDFGGYGKLTVGNYNTRDVEGALNMPLVADRLALRIAGQIARHDGYTENLGVGPDLDDRNANSFRVSLLWEPLDNLHNTLVFDQLTADEAGSDAILSGTYPAPGVPGGGGARTVANTPFFDCGVAGCDVDIALQNQQALGPRKTNTDIARYSERTIWGVANTTKLDFSSVSVKNIFGIRSTYIKSLMDMDGSPLSMNHLYRVIETRQLSDELQLFGSAFDKRLDWIVGSFYLTGEPTGIAGEARRQFIRPVSATPRLVQDYRESESKALFGQVGYDLGALLDGFKVDLGYRYTWDHGSTCTVSTPETASPVSQRDCASAGGTAGGADSAAPTWTIGVNYRPIDELLVYLTSRRGYRSAGFNSPTFAPIFADYQNYGPEELTDFEIGTKTDWQLGTWRGRVNLAAYTGKYQGIQRSITLTANMDGDGNPANDPTSMILNAAEATISGAELEVTVKPTDDLTLSLTGSHTDAQFDKFDAPTIFIPLLGANPVSNRFSYTPEWTATAGVRYEVPLAQGEIVLNANYFWSSKIWYVERPLDVNGIQASYDLVNLRADWNDIAGQHLDLSLYVRNALDEVYAAAGGFVTPSMTPTTLVYGEPRMFGLEARYRFGQ